MNPFKMLEKLPKSTIQWPIISFSQPETTSIFENVLLKNSSIDANILHSANIILKKMLLIKEHLQMSTRKYISRLISTVEWLLAENIILKLELINFKTLLNNRKLQEDIKRLILKRKIVISIKEILKLIEETEVAMKNKKKIIDKSYERPRKIVSKETIMILEENKKEKKISENNNDDENKSKV